MWFWFCLLVAYGFGVLTVSLIPSDLMLARVAGYREGWLDGRYGSPNRFAGKEKFKE